MRQRHRLATDLHGPFKYNFFSSIKKLREYASATSPYHPPTYPQFECVARRNIEAD